MAPSTIVPIVLGLAILAWSFVGSRLGKRRDGATLRTSALFDIALAICVLITGLGAVAVFAYHPSAPTLEFKWWLGLVAPVGVLVASFFLIPSRK